MCATYRLSQWNENLYTTLLKSEAGKTFFLVARIGRDVKRRDSIAKKHSLTLGTAPIVFVNLQPQACSVNPQLVNTFNPMCVQYQSDKKFTFRLFEVLLFIYLLLKPFASFYLSQICVIQKSCFASGKSCADYVL